MKPTTDTSETHPHYPAKPSHPAHADPDLIKRVLKAQRSSVIAEMGFRYMASQVPDEDNRTLLTHMADDEKAHIAYLQSITNRPIGKQSAALRRMKVESKLLGVTFTCRRLHNHKHFSKEVLASLAEVDPEAESLLAQAQRHEEQLIDLIDEERLHYVGDIVLGLNDALVEITGALAGVTFSLCNTKVVALTGIVTGISATLSMAASNYLAAKADGSDDAIKSGTVTGIAYLAAVILLVLPYLLLPDQMYAAAFWIMIATVIVILLAFNYYIAVANRSSFIKRFAQMAAVSLGVALIAYLIGLAAKDLLGITIA